MNYPDLPSSNQWTSGLCQCCSDNELCCKTVFCPCVTYGQLKEKLKGKYDVGCCTCHCWLFVLSFNIPCLTFILNRNIRSEVREKYNIEGGCCSDFWTALCCGICSLIQVANEVAQKGVGFREFE